MTSLVVRKVISGGKLKLKLVRVGSKEIRDGVGVMKLERVQVICPACGQPVEAVAGDGRVKGYCAVASQYVDFLIETQRVPIGKNPTAETGAKLSATIKKRWQDPEYRARQSAASIGRHPTAETKAKLSESMLTYWHNKKGRVHGQEAAKRES